MGELKGVIFMKKLAKIITSALSFIILLGAITYIFLPVNRVPVQANYERYITSEALINGAELVLIGTPTKDFLDRKHIMTYYESGDIQDYYTITDFKIEKIVKKPNTLEIYELENFPVVEPVGLYKSLDRKVKLAIDNYWEMKPGSKYIVFLKETNGKYCVINSNLGKFNLDKTDSDDNNIPNNDEKESFKKEILFKLQKNNDKL